MFQIISEMSSSSLLNNDLYDCQKQLHDTGLHVVLPATNLVQAKACAQILIERANCPLQIIIVEDDARLGFIKICNIVFKISNSPFFAYTAQDAFPGRQWANLAIHSLEKTKQGLLAFNDGKWFGKLASFGLARKSWAVNNYEGNLFYPGYNSHYADTELTLIALQQNHLCYNSNAVLIEVDYEKDKKSNNPKDKSLFSKRKIYNFDNKVHDQRLLNLFR